MSRARVDAFSVSVDGYGAARVGGGASTIRQHLDAGPIDEATTS